MCCNVYGGRKFFIICKTCSSNYRVPTILIFRKMVTEDMKLFWWVGLIVFLMVFLFWLSCYDLGLALLNFFSLSFKFGGLFQNCFLNGIILGWYYFLIVHLQGVSWNYVIWFSCNLSLSV